MFPIFTPSHLLSVPSPCWASPVGPPSPAHSISPLGRLPAQYTCPTRYSPVSVPPRPCPQPCVPGHSPSRLGENCSSLSFLHRSGAEAKEGLGEGPGFPGGLEATVPQPPGRALRIRTGALTSEEGARSWPGLSQVGTLGPTSLPPVGLGQGLLPTLLMPRWRPCPPGALARPP